MLIKSERYINMAAGIFEIQSLWQHRASISIGLSVHLIFMNSEHTIGILFARSESTCSDIRSYRPSLNTPRVGVQHTIVMR